MLKIIRLFLMLIILCSNIFAKSTQKAIFAGGCFWCMQHPYDKLSGVVSTTVGYIGGHTVNPTYKDVSAGITGHTEAVLVEYNSKVSYKKLLEVFWINIDPLAIDRQFCDEGAQYRSEIFYLNEEQKKLAMISKKALLNTEYFNKIATKISKADKFYPAEKYHQKYYEKNPIRYNLYRFNCGRDARLYAVWKRQFKKDLEKFWQATWK